ncbi:MAG: hypothetical protein AAGA77_07030 [Bacteroidota bacterium]
MHAQLTPTPFVDRGPLFPVNSEDARDNDLTEVGNENTTPEGTIADLKGTIFNIDGEVVPNAEVLIWQTDDRGIYDHPEAARMMGLKNVKLDPNFQYWGKTISDKDGNYYFKTIVPKPYLIGNFQRPAHIHFQVLHDGYKYLTTELHFPNDQYLDGDPVTEDLDENEHKLLMARITEPSEGTEVKEIFFNIVLNKKEQRDK